MDLRGYTIHSVNEGKLFHQSSEKSEMGRARGAGDDASRLCTWLRNREDPAGLLVLSGGGGTGLICSKDGGTGLMSSKEVIERERGSGYVRPAGRGAAT